MYYTLMKSTVFINSSLTEFGTKVTISKKTNEDISFVFLIYIEKN